MVAFVDVGKARGELTIDEKAELEAEILRNESVKRREDETKIEGEAL